VLRRDNWLRRFVVLALWTSVLVGGVIARRSVDRSVSTQLDIDRSTNSETMVAAAERCLSSVPGLIRREFESGWIIEIPSSLWLAAVDLYEACPYRPSVDLSDLAVRI
jgi:hypothetical protein